MSKISLRKLTCPKCGKEIEIEIHDSYSSDLDPNAYIDLFNKKEINITCPHCKKTSEFDHPILYNDVYNQVLIQYLPGYNNMDTVIQPFEEMQSKYVGLKNHKLRITELYPEFIEKINIFKQGYNDISMEYYKVSILDNIPEDTLLLFYYVDSKGKESIIALRENEQVDLLPFDKQKYFLIHNAFKDDPIYQRSDNYIVNFNLIQELLKEPNTTPLHYKTFKK